MKKLFSIFSLVLITVLGVLAGCNPEVPQDVVDNNMTISRLNAQKNAESYKAAAYPEGVIDKQLGEAPFRVLMQSDSSISSTCRYGDGWASGVLQFPGGGSIKLKCQTNGTGKGINGCLTESEYQTKTYKDEDGHCQNLKSLEKFK